MSVVTPETFAPSKIQYGPVSTDSKYVSIKYDGKPFLVHMTHLKVPYAPRGKSFHGGPLKYGLSAAVTGQARQMWEAISDSMGKFCLDKKEFFYDKPKLMSNFKTVMEFGMKSPLYYGETVDENGVTTTYDPLLNLKMMHDGKEFRMETYRLDDESGNVLEVDLNEFNLDTVFAKRSVVDVVVHVTGLATMQNKVFMQVKLLQALVHPPVPGLPDEDAALVPKGLVFAAYGTDAKKDLGLSDGWSLKRAEEEEIKMDIAPEKPVLKRSRAGEK